MKIKKRNKSLILLLVMPIILFANGVFFSLFFNTVSFSTISNVYPKSDIKVSTKNYFQKGDSASGNFKSSENNLGIVIIRFDKKNHVSPYGDDRLLFKIKEQNNTRWIYEREYPTNTFKDTFTIPFGFPIIDNSKDKNFHFEIISLNGNKENSVRISKDEPVLQAVHKYSKADIISSPTNIFKFITKKILVSLTNPEFLFSSTVYFLPFFFYFVWLLINARFNLFKRSLFYLVILLMLLDCFFINTSEIGIILALMGLWIVTVILYKFDNTISFLVSFILLIVQVFMTLFGTYNPYEKVSVYLYGFLIVGVLQLLYEIKYNPKKLISYNDFLKDALKLNEK